MKIINVALTTLKKNYWLNCLAIEQRVVSNYLDNNRFKRKDIQNATIWLWKCMLLLFGVLKGLTAMYNVQRDQGTDNMIKLCTYGSKHDVFSWQITSFFGTECLPNYKPSLCGEPSLKLLAQNCNSHTSWKICSVAFRTTPLGLQNFQWAFYSTTRNRFWKVFISSLNDYCPVTSQILHTLLATMLDSY